ncbi:hypothetical protein SARC_03786 [Sphaeroforma arctica JP610]|uniref:RBR-type E3 ubiquitin transferase n=1 Tax=Sphaeroforma arctica JP610 TaxID=667725 RepID=A0A0L0G4I6_9EUKA|nr:hypothetical protein SARC_03786 [Sphaeroforma arctica JP610]KNC83965.1 hypothetical protein SARC_03786 [Sphaeroforma arctica JP610]|eukprot:XP_014157867.1 hypothetical protein SARC_03786 [Sphaeroforma arctica JP610]
MSDFDFEFESDEDMGMDDDDEGFDLINEKEDSKDEALSASYVVLRPAEIIEDQLKAIDHIHQVFDTPRPTARQLLQHYHWDVERLSEKYYERDTPAHIFEAAGIADPSKAMVQRKDKGAVDCEICYEEVPQADVYGMGCNHYFCKECWKMYLEGKIQDEGVASNIECPASDCKILVDELTVTELLAEEKPVCLSSEGVGVALACTLVKGLAHVVMLIYFETFVCFAVVAYWWICTGQIPLQAWNTRTASLHTL